MLSRENVYLVFLTASWVRYSMSVPFPNNIVGDPEIRCKQDGVTLSVETSGNVASHMFAKGHAGREPCNVAQQNAATFQFGDCGMTRDRQVAPRGVMYSLIIIVQLHPAFITKVDRAYHIKCFYMEADKSLTQNLHVSMLTTNAINAGSPMPKCAYTIHSGSPNGPPVRFTQVGETVWHSWDCPSDMYGMLVHSCVVDDGQGNHVMILDENGCSTDEFVMKTPIYSRDLTRAQQETHVFKFADRISVMFNCQIRLCFKGGNTCPGMTPPSCPDTEQNGGSIANTNSQWAAWSQSEQPDPVQQDRYYEHKPYAAVDQVTSEVDTGEKLHLNSNEFTKQPSPTTLPTTGSDPTLGETTLDYWSRQGTPPDNWPQQEFSTDGADKQYPENRIETRGLDGEVEVSTTTKSATFSSREYSLPHDFDENLISADEIRSTEFEGRRTTPLPASEVDEGWEQSTPHWLNPEYEDRSSTKLGLPQNVTQGSAPSDISSLASEGFISVTEQATTHSQGPTELPNVEFGAHTYPVPSTQGYTLPEESRGSGADVTQHTYTYQPLELQPIQRNGRVTEALELTEIETGSGVEYASQVSADPIDFQTIEKLDTHAPPNEFHATSTSSLPPSDHLNVLPEDNLRPSTNLSRDTQSVPYHEPLDSFSVAGNLVTGRPVTLKQRTQPPKDKFVTELSLSDGTEAQRYWTDAEYAVAYPANRIAARRPVKHLPAEPIRDDPIPANRTAASHTTVRNINHAENNLNNSTNINVEKVRSNHPPKTATQESDKSPAEKSKITHNSANKRAENPAPANQAIHVHKQSPSTNQRPGKEGGAKHPTNQRAGKDQEKQAAAELQQQNFKQRRNVLASGRKLRDYVDPLVNDDIELDIRQEMVVLEPDEIKALPNDKSPPSANNRRSSLSEFINRRIVEERRFGLGRRGSRVGPSDGVCLSPLGFAVIIVVGLIAVLLLVFILTWMCLKHRRKGSSIAPLSSTTSNRSHASAERLENSCSGSDYSLSSSRRVLPISSRKLVGTYNGL